MYLTGDQAATLLGITRRTLYRWAHEGRLCTWEWTEERLTARAHELKPRKRGPAARRASIRYTAGRHTWPYGDRSISK